MRRLHCAVGTRYPARLDGAEAKTAGVVGERTAVAAKSAVERLRLRVLGARILAVAVRLPDLQRRVVHRSSLAVDDAPLDAHAISGHALRRKVLDHHPFQPDAKIRADGLRGARAQA